MPATLSTAPRAHYRTTAVEADWRARRRVGWGGPATTRHACAAPGRLGSIRARLARPRLEGTGPGTPTRPAPPPPRPSPLPWPGPPSPRARTSAAGRRPATAGQRTRAAWSRRPLPPPPAPTRRPVTRARLARGFSEIERKSFELDREVDVLEANVARNFDTGGGEVQNGFDPRRDQLVGDGLRRLHGHRDDGDLDPARLHLAHEVAAGEDRRRLDLVHHLPWT